MDGPLVTSYKTLRAPAFIIATVAHLLESAAVGNSTLFAKSNRHECRSQIFYEINTAKTSPVQKSCTLPGT